MQGGKSTNVMQGAKYLLFTAMLLAVTISMQCCISEHNSTFVEVEPEGWSDSAELSINNVDSAALRDISLYMRYRPLDEWRKLTLEIRTTTPSGISACDTVALYPVQHLSSHWSSTQYIEVLYRSAVVWREVGEYNISITPSSTALGYELVGIKIAQSSKQLEIEIKEEDGEGER